MKTPLLILAALSLLASASFAESPYLKELNQLVEQRNKAVDQALAPINTRFKNAAEQLLRRAAQAGDLDAAQKIKETMESGIAPNAEAIRDLRKHLAGTQWKAVDGTSQRPGLAATLTFTDGDLVEPGNLRYEVTSNRTVVIVFKGGDRQTLTLDRSGKRLELEFQQTTFAYELAP